MTTKETLEKKREDYSNALNDCMKQQYRIEGALSIINELIEDKK